MPNLGNKEQFKEINNEKSQRTIELLEKAIINLKSFGEFPEVADISKETKRIDSNGKGISKGALYKKDLTHIQDILKKHGVGKFGRLSIDKSADEFDIHDIIKIQQENKKLLKENKALMLSKKDFKIRLREMQEVNKKLNGKVIEIELKYKLHTHQEPVNRLYKKDKK